MESTVLPLTWPEDVDFSDLKRFETEARTLRYQALGRACRDKRITSLMVAHHGDDQAETVLMRMSNNRLRSGLQAMQSVEWIPECEGIYGVYRSGKALMPRSSLNIPFPVEQGGIQIVRPLLSFEKSRLIATCEEKGIEWAEDKTNQIQTMTSRNSIRYIYRNHKVPEALSIKSLVGVSLRMQKRIESHKALAHRLFDQCLMKLDIQTGSLLVRFPPFSTLLDRPIETESDKNEAMNTAYCLIERVAELVSPRPKAPLGQLAGTVDRIYPEFADVGVGNSLLWTNRLKVNYSVFSVWWRASESPSPYTDHPEPNVDSTLPHPREWLLTRQPLDIGERRNAANRVVYPPSRTASLSSHTSNSRATYHLFDGRFWIRLRNLTKDTLILRIFEKDDSRHFPTSHQERTNANQDADYFALRRPHRFMSAAFELLTASDIRHTLPAVFRLDSETGTETLIGFPTLDVRMDGFGAPEGVCEWSVRYKKVDFGSRSPDEIIVPGTSRADIVTVETRQRLQGNGVVKLKARQVFASANALKESDPFTGFKRGKTSENRKSSSRRERPNSLAQTKGEEVDELSFLELESTSETVATPEPEVHVKPAPHPPTPHEPLSVGNDGGDALSILDEESTHQTFTRPQKRKRHS